MLCFSNDRIPKDNKLSSISLPLYCVVSNEQNKEYGLDEDEKEKEEKQKQEKSNQQIPVVLERNQSKCRLCGFYPIFEPENNHKRKNEQEKECPFCNQFYDTLYTDPKRTTSEEFFTPITNVYEIMKERNILSETRKEKEKEKEKENKNKVNLNTLLNSKDGNEITSIVILIIDESLPSNELNSLSKMVLDELKELPARTLLAFLTVGKLVTLYDLNSSDITIGNTILSQKGKELISRLKKLTNCLSFAHNCRSSIKKIFRSLSNLQRNDNLEDFNIYGGARSLKRAYDISIQLVKNFKKSCPAEIITIISGAPNKGVDSIILSDSDFDSDSDFESDFEEKILLEQQQEEDEEKEEKRKQKEEKRKEKEKEKERKKLKEKEKLKKNEKEQDLEKEKKQEKDLEKDLEKVSKNNTEFQSENDNQPDSDLNFEHSLNSNLNPNLNFDSASDSESNSLFESNSDFESNETNTDSESEFESDNETRKRKQGNPNLFEKINTFLFGTQSKTNLAPITSHILGNGNGNEEIETILQKKQLLTKVMYSTISKKAQQNGIEIDLILIGPREFRVDILKKINQICGGSIFASPTVEMPAFRKQFSQIIKKNSNSLGYHSELEIKSSQNLVLQRIIGPVTQKASDHMKDEYEDNTNKKTKQTFLLGSKVNSNFSVCLKFDYIANNKQNQPAFVQIAIKYQNNSHQKIKRVFTRVLPIVKDLEPCIRSFNPEITCLLLSREFILDSYLENGLKLKEIKQIIKKIQKQFGNKFENIPKEVQMVITTFYSLIRSRLLIPGKRFRSITSFSDDLEIKRALFLRCQKVSAFRIIYPNLFAIKPININNNNDINIDDDDDDGDDNDNDNDNNGECDDEDKKKRKIQEKSINKTQYEIYQIPFVDVSLLLDDYILILDAGIEVLICIGDNIEFDLGKEIGHSFIQQLLLKFRSPYPFIHTFRNNHSLARLIKHKLIPVHKDSIIEQEIILPILKKIPKEERNKKSLERFLPTDEKSFNQFLRFHNFNLNIQKNLK
ncbi:protein transport protein sec23 [Anaeramoeba flamelloides]|uniref:Protein transport protein sec23 n=1 Tax=Anaeramoeba flamelloides TaxID=1746091 RepID=A0ABQ8XS97_9EUKA|nr:protein transport protein sec23 [Anaeramoeba flamelloides]